MYDDEADEILVPLSEHLEQWLASRPDLAGASMDALIEAYISDTAKP